MCTFGICVVLSLLITQCVLYLASSTTSRATHMKPQLKDISNWVVPYVTDKWEKICVQLLGDEHRHVMTTIRKDYHHNSEAGCEVMFEQWLELCPNPSWNDLINALRANSVRKISLAEQLIERLGMYVYVCMYDCVYVCNVMYVCMCVRMYVCMYVYVCMYICM